MNESCLIWMSHVTNDWVMSHMNESCLIGMTHVSYNESCLIWRSHVSYEGVMSHMNESCHICRSHIMYEWVVSHMKEMCHIVSHMNASCRTWMSRVTYEWVMSRMSVLTTYFCGAYEWVMSHVNGSCHAWTVLMYEWVMSRMNESCTNEQIENITSTNQRGEAHERNWSAKMHLVCVLQFRVRCWEKQYVTVSTENATPLKYTESKNSDSSVSRGTNSNWEVF